MIARGTGTDFVRHFRIPTKLEGAVAVALSGAARTIDAGRIAYRSWSGEDAAAYFVNSASAGMSGAVAQRANSSSKALGGKASFLYATLPSSPAGTPPRWRSRSTTSGARASCTTRSSPTAATWEAAWP